MKKTVKNILLLIGISIVMMITSCASSSPIHVWAPSQGSNLPPISRVALDMDFNAYYDIPVGVFGLGYLDESDTAMLQEKIASTLASIPRATSAENQRPIEIWAFIRSYMNAYTNDEVHQLACVAWCITDREKILFEDQFFVEAHGILFVMPAMARGTLYNRITERISLASVHFFRGEDEAPYPAFDVPHTFSSFEQAVKNFPESLSPPEPEEEEENAYYEEEEEIIPWWYVIPNGSINWPFLLEQMNSIPTKTGNS